ncbi:ABC transporter substrate-binding protein [Ferruginibacter sp. SUN106]|uniref:ABC transporter substrate-binding protein n=1 Tax=Ferruginibacter sp. SUN106 TaxID=2978348 RepID=UPI003D36B8E9
MKNNTPVFSLILVVLSTTILFQSCSNNQQGTEEKKLSDKLNIYNWDGILAPNTVPDFEKANSLKVTYDLYASNEELLAKLQAGAKGYDLIFPSDYMIDIMKKQNMLEKIDFSNIPNFKNISPKFKGLPFDLQNEYSVAFEYSAVGIAVDTSKVKGFKRSWSMLFDEKYKGHISMLDDIRYGMVPALKYLGYSINTTNETELNAAKELMIKQKRLVRAYSSDTYRDMLKSGDVWIAEGYTGDVYQVMRENPNIIYFIPDEGSALAVESMCIPKGAPHKYTAEYFMNYILTPKVHGTITNNSLYANPNDSAKAFIDSKIVNDKAIFIDNTIIDKSQYIQDVGNSTKFYDKVWTTIKSN